MSFTTLAALRSRGVDSTLGLFVMIMTPCLRKFTLTTHLTSSVGWAGAVIAFLALAVIGFTSPDEQTVRGAYLVMAPAAWLVLVPLAHASLLSGIALSLGTTWGLFRHYWVVLKLLITVFATVILLIYMGTFRQMAGIAADPVVDLGLVRNASPMVHAILALLLLLIATVLAVYKPLGVTPYGRRKQDDQRRAFAQITLPSPTTGSATPASSTPLWVYLSGIVVLGLLLVIIVLHLAGEALVTTGVRAIEFHGRAAHECHPAPRSRSESTLLRVDYAVSMRRPAINPTMPVPSNRIEAGSGTGVGPGVGPFGDVVTDTPLKLAPSAPAVTDIVSTTLPVASGKTSCRMSNAGPGTPTVG
jgi:hypothetical protein